MRFGRNLYKHQIPDWKEYYLPYTQLKNTLKNALQTSALQGQAPPLRDFLRRLDHAMGAVNAFYLGQRAAIHQRIDNLGRRYGRPSQSIASWSSDELAPQEADDILTTALEVRLAIQKLQWFAKVNRDSFLALVEKIESDRDIDPANPRLLMHESEKYAFGRPKDLLQQLELMEACIHSLSVLDTAHLSSSCLSFRVAFDRHFSPNDSSADRDHGEMLCSAVYQDDDARMGELLVHQVTVTNDESCLALLDLAVDVGGRKCIKALLSKLERLHCPRAESKVHGTCLHRLILRMGRKKELIGRLNPGLPRFSDVASEFLLLFVLDQLSPNQQQDVLRRDETGRTPLHYAAQYGLADTCALLLQRIRNWDLLKRTKEPLSLDDLNGHSPIHASVIQGDARVTSLLLAFPGLWSSSSDEADCVSEGETLGALLIVALLADREDVARVLLKSPEINVNYRGKDGETAVYIAARSGSVAYLQMILECTAGRNASLDIAVSGSGWTPLIAACVGDHREAVEVLLRAGADQEVQDAFGWTAKDHVAFRGHWPIADLLTAPTPSSLSRVPKRALRKTNALPPLLPDESRIFVHLGTLNTREPREAVDLRPLLSKSPFNPYPDTTFAVRIQATNATGELSFINLPRISDKTNNPAVFSTRSPDKSHLVFDLYKLTTDSSGVGPCIGRAVALLDNLKEGLGPSRESFVRNYTIPILEKSSLELLGTVTFDFLFAKPFPDPRTTMPKSRDVMWSHADSTHVVGHRGLGQNHPAFKRLQIGENTIDSFLSTAELGVSCVECDVQLTRDHIPVIYHDFLVSESGGDLAPHNLSYEQLMNLSEVQTPRSASPRAVGGVAGKRNHQRRSNSLDIPEDCTTEAFMSRMRLTHEFKVKGFKGNVRGGSIHGPFITLDELLRSLPENVSVDIELKYPMLWEAEDWKMDIYGVELNLYADTVLRAVYELAGSRAILFTSFSPELCILLSHKQNTYPVMFLNESNLFPTGDVRASNLQDAIHFARRWNLPGVVMSSEPFVMSPTLVRYVKDAGLVCASFGALNNDPENAKTQADAGLDAIIVDHVNLIARTLGKGGAVSDVKQ